MRQPHGVGPRAASPPAPRRPVGVDRERLATARPKADRARHTVLVVEDDDSARTAFADLLRGAGYSVLEARNGLDALNSLRSDMAVSVIVLDLMMPVMDGWSFLTERKMDPVLATIPAIVLSEIPPVHPQGRDLPVTFHCTKPFQLDYLLELVRCVIGDDTEEAD